MRHTRAVSLLRHNTFAPKALIVQKLAGLLASLPFGKPSHPTLRTVVLRFRKCLLQSYSSGDCPGFTPGSLLGQTFRTSCLPPKMLCKDTAYVKLPQPIFPLMHNFIPAYNIQEPVGVIALSCRRDVQVRKGAAPQGCGALTI